MIVALNLEDKILPAPCRYVGAALAVPGHDVSLESAEPTANKEDSCPTPVEPFEDSADLQRLWAWITSGPRYALGGDLDVLGRIQPCKNRLDLGPAKSLARAGSPLRQRILPHGHRGTRDPDGDDTARAGIVFAHELPLPARAVVRTYIRPLSIALNAPRHIGSVSGPVASFL